MGASDTIAGLVKASEVVRSLANDMSQNGPLVISISIGLSSIALASDSLLPARVAECRWLFASASISSWAYFLLLVWFARRPHRAEIKHLDTLGVDEQQVLQRYLKQNRAVCHFAILHGPSSALVAKGVLYYATALIPAFDAPVAIKPHVMRFLRRHPELIGLSEAEVGKEPLSDDTVRATFEA
jgi:hypothetical protein